MMRKEVSRARKLPAFKIDLADFGNLVCKIAELFDEGQFKLSIDVDLKGQKYSFDSVEEMHNCIDLPDQLKSFSLFAFGEGRYISFHAGGFIGTPASVDTKASSEAWCAGAVEVVYQFTQQHRRWYSSIRGWPLGALVFLALWFPSISKYAVDESPFDVPRLFWPWLVALCVTLFIYITRSRLLPVAIIQVSLKENIIKRYLPELTLLVAVLSLVFTVLSWFLGNDA